MVRTAGIVTPFTGLRSSSIRIRLAPQRGCRLRISATRTSTEASTW